MSHSYPPHHRAEDPVWSPGGQQPPAPARGPGAPLTAIEALRQRSTAQAPSPSPVASAALAPPPETTGSPLRFLGAAVAGMFTADTVVRPTVEFTARAQRPLTTGRRVTIIGAHPRAGVTTTAVTAALLLARIRRERIALLGLGPDPTALAVRSGCLPRYSTEDVATALDQRRDAAVEDVLALMDQIAANGWAIGYQRDASSHSAARLARTFSQLFGATLVDAGSALQGQTMSLLDTSNAVVLLGDGSKEGMRSIEVAFSNLMATGLVPTTQLVIGLVQTVKSSKIDLGWESDIVRRQGIRSVGIPWDPQLATAQQVRPEMLGPTTLRAFARLLAEVVDTSMSAGGAA